MCTVENSICTMPFHIEQCARYANSDRNSVLTIAAHLRPSCIVRRRRRRTSAGAFAEGYLVRLSAFGCCAVTLAYALTSGNVQQIGSRRADDPRLELLQPAIFRVGHSLRDGRSAQHVHCHRRLAHCGKRFVFPGLTVVYCLFVRCSFRKRPAACMRCSGGCVL